MSQCRVYLGIGSNIGDRASTIKQVCEALAAFLGRFEQASLYESLPREVTDQPPFLNTVVSGCTDVTPAELLARTSEIERAFGRNRSEERRKGPRTVDIDILLFGTRSLDSDDLTVPHPRMTERKFVLVPLLELAPLAVHPGTGIAFQDYLDSLAPQGIYYFSSSGYSRDNSRHR